MFTCIHDDTHTITEDAVVQQTTVNPTCLEEGKTTFTATISFEEKEYTDQKEEILDKVDHNLGEWKTVKEPTFTEKGVKERICSICNEKQTEEIPLKQRILFEDVMDVKMSFYDAVYWAVDNGITTGTSKNPPLFSPYRNCTRGQFVTFLWREEGCPEPKTTTNPFTDIDESKSFYKAVLWAFENEITTGTSATTFEPYKDVNRAQVATFLWRAKGEPSAYGDDPFTDVPENVYFTKAVAWMVNYGITKGTTPTTFSPNKDCTRGQTVTFLYRTYAE